MSHGRSSTQALKKRFAIHNPRLSQAESREHTLNKASRKSKIPIITSGSVRGSAYQNGHGNSVGETETADRNYVDTAHNVNGANTYAYSDKKWHTDRHIGSSKGTKTSREVKTRHTESRFQADGVQIKDFEVAVHSNGENYTTSYIQDSNEDDSENVSRINREWNDAKKKTTEPNDASCHEDTVLMITSRRTTQIKILSPSAQRKVLSEKLRKQSYGRSKKQRYSSNVLESLSDLRWEAVDDKVVSNTASHFKHHVNEQPLPKTSMKDNGQYPIQHKELNGSSIRPVSDQEQGGSWQTASMERQNSPGRKPASRQNTQVKQTTPRQGTQVKQITPRDDKSQNASRHSSKLVDQKSRENSEMKQLGWQKSAGIKKISSPDHEPVQASSRQNTKMSKTSLTQSSNAKRRNSQQSAKATPRQNTESVSEDNEISGLNRQLTTELKETKSRHNAELAKTISISNSGTATSRQSFKSRMKSSAETQELNTSRKSNKLDLETTVSKRHAQSRQSNVINKEGVGQNNSVKRDTSVKQEDAVPTNWRNSNGHGNGRTRDNSAASLNAQDRSKAVVNSTGVSNGESLKTMTDTLMRTQNRADEVKNTKGTNVAKTRENTEIYLHSQDRSGVVDNTTGPNIGQTRENSVTSVRHEDRSGAVNNTRGSNVTKSREASEISATHENGSGAVNNSIVHTVTKSRENSKISVRTQDRAEAGNPASDRSCVRTDDDDSWPEIPQSPSNTSFSRHNSRIDSRHGAKRRSSDTGETRDKPHNKQSPSPKVPPSVTGPQSSPDIADPTLNDSLSLPELNQPNLSENRCSFCEMTFKSSSQLDFHMAKLCFARSKAFALNDMRETRELFTIGSVFHSSPRDWVTTGQVSLRMDHKYLAEDQYSKASNFHWDKCFNGRVTEFAVKVGYDFNAGCSVYVCRAKVNKELVPGQVVPAYKCANVACAGNEVKVTDYEVLTDPHELLSWKSTDIPGAIPRGAKKGGHDANGMVYYIARASAPDGSMCCGRYVPQDHKCYYAWKGDQLSTVKFDFLCKTAS